MLDYVTLRYRGLAKADAIQSIQVEKTDLAFK